MGQVITVDFAARKTSSHPNAADTPPASGGQPASDAVVALPTVSSVQTSPVPMSPAGEEPAARMPRDTAETRQPDNLADACAEMRVRADALASAVEKLRRASDDLQSLPGLARELCDAAV